MNPDRIILLPDNVKNMIAAGEVVEGPFSVVKELVENSLDAGASEVDVQVWDSGLRKIVVRDNGSGIHSDDMGLSIMEHATSKIADGSSLERIFTYGFRGEALSSIASISDFVLLSRRREEEKGARLESLAGNVSISEYMGAPGTTVIVENLFHNVPARKKFLKVKTTELRNIREILLKTAIPVFNTAFSFEVEGKREITLPAATSLAERIKQVFGPAAADNLYYEELNDLKVHISGFLSKPGYIKSSRNMQFLYINNRPVEHRYFQYHLSRAYEAVCPKGKYPAAIVFIQIDPSLTDVNVHPAKREVRLFDQKYIDELVYGLARKALNRFHDVRLPEASAAGHSGEEAGAAYASAVAGSTSLIRDGARDDYSGSLFGDVAAEVPQPVPCNDEHSGIRVLGVIFGTYIVAEKDESMHIIDFHAAHERIIYDRLMESGSGFESQELLFPVTFELPVADFRAAMDSIDIFKATGFEIEEFPDCTLLVRSLPVIAGGDDIEILVKNMIANIREDKNSTTLREKFISTLACHSARRSGDSISGSEALTLASAVFSMTDLRCPHGRPFVYTLSKNEIERMFKRI